MNIKILAALAVSAIGLSAGVARADGHGGHWSHDNRGGYSHGGDRGHNDRGVYGRDDRGGYGHGGDRHSGGWHEGYAGYGHRDHDRDYGYRYAPRRYEPHYRSSPYYNSPGYYSPSYYSPSYYAPRYYESGYPGAWFDDLGVVIQLHLP